MYILQEKPEKVSKELLGGCQPLATLRSKYGGVAHIISDDHCYVLMLDNTSGHGFVSVKHWFKEAVKAVQGLPLPI